MTNSGIALRRSSKVQICTKKDHSQCLMICCLSDPLQLSESLWNHYIWEACSTNQWDALKTATPSASTGQEKVPNSPWKHPTRHHTTNTSNVEWIGPWSFASPAIFTRPLANWWPFLQISWQLLQEKCFHNQPDAENAFHEFVKSRSMNFYTTGINKLMKG